MNGIQILENTRVAKTLNFKALFFSISLYHNQRSKIGCLNKIHQVIFWFLQELDCLFEINSSNNVHT